MDKRGLIAYFFIFLVVIVMAIFSLKKSPVPTATPSPSPDEALESLNSRNRTARNAVCPSIRTSFFSKSSVIYQKPDRVLFSTKLAERQEAILGNDGDNYWFWIRSFDPDSTYFCPSAKLDEYPLNPVMRPEVVACMAWIDELKPDSPPKRKNDGYVATQTKGRISKRVEFDSEKMTSQHIFIDGFRVVSMDALEFVEVNGLKMPSKVRAKWHEQRDMSGIFVMEGWQINVELPPISLNVENKKEIGR